MRRFLLTAGGVIGVIILIAVGLIGYAYFNLNSIIASQRGRLLARVSDAVGRPIEATGDSAPRSNKVAGSFHPPAEEGENF